MEARVATFPNRHEAAVRVEPDRIVIERVVLPDPALAAWLGAQPLDDHVIIVERAVRIGLTALQSVGVTLNVDAVRSEFERFAEQNASANEKAAAALEQVLRSNFADGDGRLPRTLETFLDALHGAGVALVLDVRQRRGVRGPEYAWANAQRLQAALAGAGIEYRHHKELAPTTELRQLQYREDDRLGVGKRSRAELAPAYRERYLREILGQVDLAPIVEELPPGADRGHGRRGCCSGW